jgi:pterin-4a-carbinolamine dehydratase
MNDWEILKEKGNEEFKKKNYQAAINFYSQAIGKI